MHPPSCVYTPSIWRPSGVREASQKGTARRQLKHGNEYMGRRERDVLIAQRYDKDQDRKLLKKAISKQVTPN